MNIGTLYQAGVDKMAFEHEEQEHTKVGTLRAGNTGCIINGEVVGMCARLTLLRYLGIKWEEIASEKRLMFDAGLSNEDIWVKCLQEGIKAHNLPYVIKTEEDIPIKWQIGETNVTGRPDIVLGIEEDGEFVPKKGLELKLASSLWTCRDTGVLLEPKLAHLMQAGHYAWQLNIPFELWYTNRAEFAVGSGWEQKTFPEEQDTLTDVLEWTERVDRRSGKKRKTVKKVRQYRQGYALEWQADYLVFTPILEHRTLPPTKTGITISGIKKYYETVLRQAETRRLAARPVMLKTDGSKANYTPCSYCPLSTTCDRMERNYDEWLSEVQGHSDYLKKEK